MTFLKFGMVALTAFTLAACSSTTEEGTTDPNASVNPNGTFAENSVQYFNSVVGDRVLFETDSSALDGVARDTLNRQAAWLKTNAATTVVIEGHADERGTREYNLALGARRANAAFTYLVSQGVDAARLRTVTYGKERPVATCSDESCWSQNRRAMSVVAGAPAS